MIWEKFVEIQGVRWGRPCPLESVSQTVCRSDRPFLQSSPVCPVWTTERVTSVAVGASMRCMRRGVKLCRSSYSNAIMYSLNRYQLSQNNLRDGIVLWTEVHVQRDKLAVDRRKYCQPSSTDTTVQFIT